MTTQDNLELVLRHSGKHVFIYDLRSGSAADLVDALPVLGLPKAVDDFESALLQGGRCLPECADACRIFLRALRGGRFEQSAELLLKTVNREPRWFHFDGVTVFEGGAPHYAVVSFFDCSEQREWERLHLYEEVYRMAAAHIRGTVYRFDIDKRTETTPPEMAGDFKLPSCGENVPESIIAAGYIAPECVEAYRDFYSAISQGVEGRTLRLRRRLSDGSYRWFEGAYTIIRAGDGSPSAAVVTYEDIEDELREREMLIESASHDSMTGLLNHAAMQQRVESCLENGGAGLHAAMLMIDVDNFKQINDTLGHQTGDEALVCAADAIRRAFRDSDLVGRIGGDEFMVFICGGIDAVGVKRKASALLKALCFPVGSQRLSASIGAALSHGKTSFAQLYSQADRALYEAKRDGKNTYRLFICG